MKLPRAVVSIVSLFQTAEVAYCAGAWDRDAFMALRKQQHETNHMNRFPVSLQGHVQCMSFSQAPAEARPSSEACSENCARSERCIAWQWELGRGCWHKLGQRGHSETLICYSDYTKWEGGAVEGTKTSLDMTNVDNGASFSAFGRRQGVLQPLADEAEAGRGQPSHSAQYKSIGSCPGACRTCKSGNMAGTTLGIRVACSLQAVCKRYTSRIFS